jgi:serine/threonine protein phosphatase PrpC
MTKVFVWSLKGKRESNEDQHYYKLNLSNENNEYNDINLFGVFDGHGGKAVSKYLKNNLPQFFITKFNKNIYQKKSVASEYFIKVYNFLQNKMLTNHPRYVQYCGSTACVVIHYKKNNRNNLWILNVGDSRAIKCNNLNIAEQLSQDHKPNSPSERIRIEKLGGKIYFDGSDWRIGQLSLSRAFGDADSMPYVTHMPEIYNYKLKQNDKFLVIACDGLWDVLTNQDVVDFVNNLINNNANNNYAKELAEHALNKGSMDNITVIIYFL